MEIAIHNWCFFQHVKSILPPHISFVDEVAGLLNISMTALTVV